MTLYPRVRNVKKVNLAVKIMLLISIIAGIICILVNVLTSTRYMWSIIVIVGIIYFKSCLTEKSDKFS